MTHHFDADFGENKCLYLCAEIVLSNHFMRRDTRQSNTEVFSKANGGPDFPTVNLWAAGFFVLSNQ
jgi:hypothetical protein